MERRLSERNPPWCLLFNAPSTSKHKLRSLTSCSDWLLLKLCDQSVCVNRSSGNDTPQCKSTTEIRPARWALKQCSPPQNLLRSGFGRRLPAAGLQGGKQKLQAGRIHTTEENLDPNLRYIKTQLPIIAHEEWIQEGGGRAASDMFRGDEYFMMPAERSVRLIICEAFTAE